MSNANFPNISLQEYFNLLVGFISDDLTIHKHLHHLSLSGLDTTPLKLRLHERIFKLAGLKKETQIEAIEDWYFKQAEKVYEIDVINDQNTLLQLSIEIFEGLMKARNGSFVTGNSKL